jgi:hypothetical protein
MGRHHIQRVKEPAEELSAVTQFAPYFASVGRYQAAGAAAVAAEEFVAGWFAVMLDDVDDVLGKGGA